MKSSVDTEAVTHKHDLNAGNNHATMLQRVIPAQYQSEINRLFLKRVDKKIYTRNELVPQHKSNVVLNEGHAFELLNEAQIHDFTQAKHFRFVDTENQETETWMVIPTSTIIKAMTKRPEIIEPVLLILYHQMKNHVTKAYPVRGMLQVPEFRQYYTDGKRDATNLYGHIQRIKGKRGAFSRRNRGKGQMISDAMQANGHIIGEVIEKFNQL